MIVQKMRSKFLFGLMTIFASLINTACASNDVSELPEWKVSVSFPSLYPVNVTQAYGTNYEHSWNSPIHGFSQFMSKSKLENVNKRFSDYDGYGVPIHTLTMLNGSQVSGLNTLPDTLYLSWTSITNTQFYITKFSVSEDIKKEMSRKDHYIGRSGDEITCYRTEFVFGLLPNGNAKIWIKGCNSIVFLQEVPPFKVNSEDSLGFDVADYKQRSYLGRIQKRAEDAGATLDPIPWDKVNKVYSNYEITELN
ncbi:DUF2931 family protein [Vibrio europaeus]|uniref:DUF2931 family protein n=1 Tax=Vibrio europaeus TaxID=300876 RepID=UPI00233E9F3E|nr:DUF2931 family protein [Vibrio europaeus]MDC5821627.1 DUF2931 family protein [Vibrio europaeus]MDC5868625.1 DUF2931 family protein [Vibrio europaeus]